MAEFQVFENVKLPPAKHGAGFGPRESKYPFKDLEVGNLMVIEGKTSKAFGGTVRAAEKSTGFAFVIRSGPITEADIAEGGDVNNVIVPKGSLGVFRVAKKAERKAPERTAEQKAASSAKAAATRAANKAAKAAK